MCGGSSVALLEGVRVDTSTLVAEPMMGVKPVGDVRVAYAEATKIVENNLVRYFIDKAVGGSTDAVRWQGHRCDVAAQHHAESGGSASSSIS